MTTNSLNPFVGDVQALITDCKKEIETIENYLIAYPDHPALLSELQRQQVALVALMAEPCGYHSEGAMQIDPVWPTPYGAGFRVEPKPNGIYNIPVYQAQPVQVLRPIVLKGGSLKSDGHVWYKAETIIELAKEAGYEVKP